MNKVYLTWDEIFEALETVDYPENVVYGIPKGGMIAAGFLKHAEITGDPSRANVFLDDVKDSGWTESFYKKQFPGVPFVVLIDKTIQNKNDWIVFPWEADHPHGVETIEQNIVRQLQYIGEDPERSGIVDTPKRIVKSWNEIFAGYKQKPEDIFTIFNDEKKQFGGMVYLRDIEFHSMCEHHWLPFYGKATIAYIPDGPVIGVSKLARLLDIYSRRLQIQERIAEQVTDSIMKNLKPLGAACMIEARHMCIACRGVRKQHSVMGYNSLKGVFLEDSHMGIAARNELMLISK
jgi:GTP cyclohydrolase I